jgi:DnaK suppressor protein
MKPKSNTPKAAKKAAPPAVKKAPAKTAAKKSAAPKAAAPKAAAKPPGTKSTPSKKISPAAKQAKAATRAKSIQPVPVKPLTEPFHTAEAPFARGEHTTADRHEIREITRRVMGSRQSQRPAERHNQARKKR